MTMGSSIAPLEYLCILPYSHHTFPFSWGCLEAVRITIKPPKTCSYWTIIGPREHSWDATACIPPPLSPQKDRRDVIATAYLGEISLRRCDDFLSFNYNLFRSEILHDPALSSDLITVTFHPTAQRSTIHSRSAKA